MPKKKYPTGFEAKERPIIFSGEMVKAVLDGHKTQTRRPVKVNAYGDSWDVIDGVLKAQNQYGDHVDITCPYGQPGDLLWVKETFLDGWAVGGYAGHVNPDIEPDGETVDVVYRADGELKHMDWKPSIHMPRWASRITLEITNVRVERLQSITHVDALKEGMFSGTWRRVDGEIPSYWASRAVQRFINSWNSVYGKTEHAWENNLWVWVIEFKRTN